MEKITKDMGIIDVIQKYPETAEVFANLGLGCLGCAAAHYENLEAIARVHGIDLDSMLAEFNKIVEKA